MHLKCSMELGEGAQTSNPRTLWMTTVKDHFDPFGKCVCATLMCLGPSEVRRVICSPENGVKRAENCHVVAEKWTWVFYKGNEAVIVISLSLKDYVPPHWQYYLPTYIIYY